jgi:hypothetical protein
MTEHEHTFRPYRPLGMGRRVGVYVWKYGRMQDIASPVVGQTFYDRLLTEDEHTIFPTRPSLRDHDTAWFCDCGEQGVVVPA